MNVEIVEFYQIECNEAKQTLRGTLRLKLPDIGLHILGIYVSKRKNSWFFSLPKGKDLRPDGSVIKFPLISFEDNEKQKELIAAIRDKGRAFIENKLANIENVLSQNENEECTKLAEVG